MSVGAPYLSQADLGGEAGHGPVRRDPKGASPFHADWEARVLAITLAMGATGQWNIDMSRVARETLPDYRTLDYYRIWLAALERLLQERGLVQADELAAGRALHAPRPVARVLHAGEVAAALSRGSPTVRPASGAAPRFAVGDAVRTRSASVAHHTRLPGYAQGKRGTIERVHGRHVFADSHAHGLGEDPQWLYGVAFDGAELWGAQAAPGLVVAIDAWEPYLEAA
jgi:nitrile hydratase subunit beta